MICPRSQSGSGRSSPSALLGSLCPEASELSESRPSSGPSNSLAAATQDPLRPTRDLQHLLERAGAGEAPGGRSRAGKHMEVLTQPGAMGV